MNVQRKIPSRLHHTAYVTNDLEIAPAKLGATPRGAAGFSSTPSCLRREAPGCYRSVATRLTSTAARAFETGHSTLAA